MAIWPFNRTKKQSNAHAVPAEVQQYYDAERREHIGVAWLIALLSLTISIALFTGIFFGGRWVYRKVAHKANKPATTAQTETKDTSKTEGDSEQKPSSSDANKQTAGSTTPPQTSSTSTTTPQAATAPTSGDLPHTGPDSDE